MAYFKGHCFSMNLFLIFFTGLTTGGLTCLAVQGGLLATTLAKQVTVADKSGQTNQSTKQRLKARTEQNNMLTGIQFSQNIYPVIYFLLAKLLAYTLLGFFLGTLGSAIQISPLVRAALQILAGLFMLATALNMFNVHPIFRYFVIQPPKVLTKLVREQSRSQEIFAPALLGLMTVLIPCGTTQAMEALAITTGNPVLGALIMFFFVLGTSPTFLVLGFLASRIRGKYRSLLAMAAALAILFLGILAIDGGLNLLGSPAAPSRVLASLNQRLPTYTVQEAAQAIVVDGVQELNISVGDYGYSPNSWIVASGQPIRLRLSTYNNYGCTRAFVIPSLGIQEILPETGETIVDLPAQQSATLYFTCGMGMYNGTIVIQ
jgi:sulfite exporter TauE/SafE